MHNSLARLQAAFGYFTSCAFALAAFIAFLSILPYPTQANPSATIAVRNVQVVKGRLNYWDANKVEYAQVRFDLKADLSSLFTWNTKQLFVYVTANYQDSEIVIWDAIMPGPPTPFSVTALKAKYYNERIKRSSKVIALKNQKPKYHITLPRGHWQDIKNATLSVSWNVQPWVGALLWDKGYLGSRVASWKAPVSKPFDFPPVKGSKVPKQAARPEGGEALPVVEV